MTFGSVVVLMVELPDLGVIICLWVFHYEKQAIHQCGVYAWIQKKYGKYEDSVALENGVCVAKKYDWTS